MSPSFGPSLALRVSSVNQSRGHCQSMGVGEAICTMREVVAVMNRPQDIEDEEAMSFFGGSEGDADESQG